MDLHVKFDGHEIIVTRPGTDMMTAYRKRPDSPNLVLTRSWEKPTVTSPEISEFRALRSPKPESSGGSYKASTPVITWCVGLSVATPFHYAVAVAWVV